MFRLAYKEIFFIAFIGILILTVINLIWVDNIFIFSFTAVIGSVFASIIVSIIYQNILHDSFQLYRKIGLRKTFHNFEEALDPIRGDISRSREIDILFMFGSSFINNSSSYLIKALSNKSTKMRIFIFSETNPYTESYGGQWGADNEKYNKDGIVRLISNSRNDIKKIYEDIDENKRGSLEIYELKNSALSYSFYKMDDHLYFVPTKLTTYKFYKHPVFLFKKTKDESNMFNSINKEIENMINKQEIDKIYPG